MRRGWILLLLLAALALPVSAADVLEQERQILQVDSLTDPLSGQTREALEDYSPASQTDPASAILDIFKWASNLSVGTLREAVQTGAMLLTAALICQLVRQAYPKDRLQLQSLTGAFAITALFAASMKSMIGLATGVLDEMEAYAKLLLPVMCGAASAAGALSGAGCLYMGSSLFFSLLTSLIRALLLPLVYAYLGLATVECGLPDERLGSVRTLLGWCISALLKGVMYVFTAYLSLTGLLSGSSDEAAVNAAKSTLSAALPVVGGIAADASEAVLQSAKLLRATAGTFGILAVLAIALMPFLKIAICYLTMKLTAAAAGLAAGKEHAALLGAQTSAMGYLQSMRGASAAVFDVLLYEGGGRMIEAVRGYLLRITAGAFAGAILLAALPKGTPRRVAAMLCGLLMLLLALTPLAELDYDSLAEAISRLELEKEEARTGIEIQNQELVASIISGRVQTYILDKASSLGMQISVELEMETRAATPYPSGVTIRGTVTPAQKQQLQTYLEQTFAIAPERQVWLP